jgi:hypothetical protein
MDTTANLRKRFVLFLVGCIGTRALAAYTAKVVSAQWLRYMGYLALLPAVGFAVIWLTGARKTGAEVFGARIWWNDLRPVHSALYFLFAVWAIKGWARAWLFLLADVAIGLGAFLWHHFAAGDFARIL